MGLIGDAFIEGTNDAISGVVEEIIASKAKQFVQKVLKYIVTEKELKELEEMQKEYLRICYKKNRYMNTIVLRGQKKTINELYIPLTLRDKVNRSEIFYIDEKGMNIFQKHDKVLIVDNAGMGKSTIVKYFTMLNFQNIDRMPVVIELRNLKEVNSIEEYIQKEMNSIHREFPLQFVKDLLNGGDFIICFDGFDEVAESERENVIKMIKNFVAKAGNNIFVLTSREDNALTSFGGFKEFHIQGLKKAEAYQLIEKYSSADEYPDSVNIGKELIEKLKTENNIAILNEFLSNPLMVSLLYKTYLRYRDIPNKKHLFYKRVYTVLYEEHDLTKNGYKHIKKSGLDIEEMKTVLSYLGWYFVKNEIVECTEEKLIDIIEKVLAKAFRDKKVKAKDFLEDILQAVPFFIKEGEYCRWIHKSFSEYFAACYLCNKNSKEMIEKIFSKEYILHYDNILHFCFDMSENMKNIIIYTIVKNFIQYYNSSYQNKYFKQFDKNLIDLKKKLGFCYDQIILTIDCDNDNRIYILPVPSNKFIISTFLYKRKIDIFNSCCYNDNNNIDEKDKDNLILFIKNENNIEYRRSITMDNKGNIINIKNGCVKNFNSDDEDSQDSILNKKIYIEYFAKHLLKFHINCFKGKLIDYEKCVTMKKSIEEYWARQKENDDMFD
ncbi:NACHT domain-containing protein [Clostridium sp. MD294]|uniref:NACHT domain-containing protein n=1 Tax=Clostridium sp. MD294 TaxID=97138 RepID=UPI0002CB7231|nr:NACHT domain-containing protein [Clostridium sp. MD294]NDO45842.1 hypothetical protein [Clostridium sp. MD294]USF30503.1 hypothetical protein C820_001944 [Clostridium sp. MD294]